MDKLIKNKKLYEEVKADVNKRYSKNSAYRSGMYILEYKRRGGEFLREKPKNIDKLPLARWFKEDWADIGGKNYPVYRPRKRISKLTPLTQNEIDKKDLEEKIKLKQKIKGEKNLPPFRKKLI